MERIIKCPLCGEITEEQDFEFWKCPNCGCEVWPEDEEETEKAKALAIREVYYDNVRIPLIKKRRSGGRSGRRYGKKKVVPPLWSQRYALY